MSTELAQTEKRLLFWASYLSLMAAGVGFAFRVAKMGEYQAEFELTNLQVAQIFGATFWPLAITMILFSLVVDRTGYKVPMYLAFVLQAIAGIGTALSDSYKELYFTALAAGLGHGIIEAVINPACVAVYPRDKTKMLTILHAAWPAGLVFGTLFIMATDALAGGDGLSWKIHALWILLPAVPYAVMYVPCKFPVDERVKAGVPYSEMLREVGFLGSTMAAFMLIYEIGNQASQMRGFELPTNWFWISVTAGIVTGAMFGLFTKSFGKPLFFLMCLLMVPLATAEVGTDQWIKKLMTPVLEGFRLNPAFSLVFSASIMLIFRSCAGGILKHFTPPFVLCFSGLFCASGLFWLSKADGTVVFIAFVLYALGQTYTWPCAIGFVSERFPRGGALTLNTVSAVGVLSIGIIGGQIMGVAFDKTEHAEVREQIPMAAAAAEDDKKFMGVSYTAIIPEKFNDWVDEQPPDVRVDANEKYTAIQNQAGRGVLAFSVVFPSITFIVFGMIWIYFRSKGGYKQIHLEEDGQAIEADPGL
jgi:MFS family permease